MNNLKTLYSSYSINHLPKGCRYCVRGQKSVLFISGICSRNCIYCSLSEKRKNKDIIYCNETICNTPKQAIQEIKQSNSKGIGITGGDPLVCLNKTLNFAKAIKKQFGNSFHIHIYLPTKLVTKEKLKKLSKYIDEVRFHPEFLIKEQTKQERQADIDKIKLASLFWKKQNLGVELPMIPDKKQDILNFIKEISQFIGFVNLNEFEISETNFDYITNKYKMNKDSYTINKSNQAGLWILNQCKKNKKNNIKLNIHLCTAQLKNFHQFKNRLKLHNILPYGKRTSDGTIIYLAIYNNLNKLKSNLKKNSMKDYYLDKTKNRLILSEPLAKKLLKLDRPKFKIERVEEFPTSDMIEVEREFIN